MPKVIYNMRFPELTHAQIKACSNAKGMSMHSYILTACAKEVERDKHLLMPMRRATKDTPASQKVQVMTRPVVWTDE